MSKATIEDVFAPIEAKYKADIMKNTWGHLAPKKNKVYKGKIVYAVGCFGNDSLNPTVLVCNFKELDSSPWFFNALTDFIHSLKLKEEGCVYEFEGYFKNYVFVGRVLKISNYN
jgi:hypothetical protein